MDSNTNERDTRPATDICAESEEIAKILPKLSAAGRQRILGAVKYAEMIEATMSDKAS